MSWWSIHEPRKLQCCYEGIHQGSWGFYFFMFYFLNIFSVFCLLFCYFRLRTRYKLLLPWGAGRLLPVRGGGPEDFQTDPPLHPSFLEMTPYTFYILWKVTPTRLLWKLRIIWLQIVPKCTISYNVIRQPVSFSVTVPVWPRLDPHQLESLIIW